MREENEYPDRLCGCDFLTWLIWWINDVWAFHSFRVFRFQFAAIWKYWLSLRQSQSSYTLRCILPVFGHGLCCPVSQMGTIRFVSRFADSLGLCPLDQFPNGLLKCLNYLTYAPPPPPPHCDLFHFAWEKDDNEWEMLVENHRKRDRSNNRVMAISRRAWLGASAS